MRRLRRRGGLAAAVLTTALAVSASEIHESYRDALKDYLHGIYSRAAKNYEYLVSLGSEKPAPAANLALVNRDMGRPEVAAAHWLKATLLDSSDPFLWNQRGWNYLSLSRFREARDSFRKAIAVSTASVYAAEAHFGMGLTESIDGNTKQALRALGKSVASGNPYLQPAVYAELGRVNVRTRHYPAAVPFLTSSLSRDREQPEIARLLGKVFQKTGEGKAAWQAYKLTLDKIPDDRAAAKATKKLEKYISGRPADSMPWTRLARPLMRNPDPAQAALDAAGKRIRVAMFSGPDGRMRHLTRCYIMGSTSTRLHDLRLGESIDTASTYSQWEVLYRSDNRVVEIRDTAGKIVYVTKQPFRFQPLAPGFTVLLKNPEVTDIRGIDLSDRELRGSVDIYPTPLGFHVVNDLSLNEYLFSVIGRVMPRTKAKEAYKAVAVLMRTNTIARMSAARTNTEHTQLCDSDYCVPYFGLTRERRLATEAVRETRKVSMAPSKRSRLEYHKSCGWASVGGIQDRPSPRLLFRHPYDLERLTHGYPDAKGFNEGSAAVPPIWNRWVRSLDAKELRANLDRIKPLGPIKRVRVNRRDATGRVRSMTIEGASGKIELKGFAAIEKFLSPNSLRSTLFTLQPLYKGRKLRRLLVWGAGTGHGRGLCVAGTMGQAHLGRRFDAILRHYFPTVRLVGVPPPPKAAVKPKKRRSRKYRPLGRRKPRKRRRPR